jgi:hypothetical protein
LLLAHPASDFRAVLGEPTRVIAAGPPAPVGHRNNQIHIYDSLGIYFNEHHYTYLLSAVTFLLDPDSSSFQLTTPFSGSLLLGDLSISTPFPERDLASSGLPFVQRLSGSWALNDDTPIRISLDSVRKIVNSVSICLPRDPHDKSYRPTWRSVSQVFRIWRRREPAA